MESKQPDVMAILKLYALRRDEKMRAARAWFFTEFNPASASDIVKLMFSGEANTEHLAVFAKLEPFMVEVREVFGEAPGNTGHENPACHTDYGGTPQTVCQLGEEPSVRKLTRQQFGIHKGDINHGVTFCVGAPSPIMPAVVYSFL